VTVGYSRTRIQADCFRRTSRSTSAAKREGSEWEVVKVHSVGTDAYLWNASEDFEKIFLTEVHYLLQTRCGHVDLGSSHLREHNWR
jgi:hypothetical protein